MKRREAHSRAMANRISQKKALPFSEVFKLMIRQGGATATHNAQRVYMAWNQASGSEEFTLKRFFRDGRLVVTLNSSVVRSSLSFSIPVILDKMNAILDQDSFLIRPSGDSTPFVKEIVLK